MDPHVDFDVCPRTSSTTTTTSAAAAAAAKQEKEKEKEKEEQDSKAGNNIIGREEREGGREE